MWLEPITHCWMGMNFNTQEVWWAVYVEDSFSFKAGYEF